MPFENAPILWKFLLDNIRGYTVHIDNLKFFICPTSATNYFKLLNC